MAATSESLWHPLMATAYRRRPSEVDKLGAELGQGHSSRGCGHKG